MSSESWKQNRTTGQWAKILGKHAKPLQKDWFAMVAASTKRGKLSEKMKHLIWTAVDAVPTHLYQPGGALHAEEALNAGASVAELMDALRIASLPTIQGLRDGYAILEAEVAKTGEAGDWRRAAERLGPEFIKAYENFAASRMPGGLSDKDGVLVEIGVLGCPAVMDREGLQKAIRRALDLGHDKETIAEAMEIASLIGTHAFSLLLDRISEPLDRHAAKTA